MAEQIEQAIADNAAGPAKAAGDSTSFEQHKLPDQIAADKYLANKAAMKRKGFGLTIAKIVPPGSV